MKLCITASGQEFEAKVDTTFGRAGYFQIIDTETMARQVVENSAAASDQGAGIAAAQLVTDNRVDAVLTGFVGPNAFNALQAGKVKIYEGASSAETVQEALAKYQKGEYKEAETSAERTECRPGMGRGRGCGLGRGRGSCRRQTMS